MTEAPAPEPAVEGPPADPDVLRAADGRMPGRRGLATRLRLLECTNEMLRSTSYRDIKVVDIAREAGTSPATFYQYFPDVESAIMELAEDMARQRRRFSDLVRTNPWRGKAGYDGAIRLADEFIEFWEEHQPVLRVVDLATEEGDGRFANVRTRLLNDLYNSLVEALQESKASGRIPDEVEATATAGVLVSMLAHVAAHRYGFEFWGVRTADLRTAMARIIFWSVSGQRPVS